MKSNPTLLASLAGVLSKISARWTLTTETRTRLRKWWHRNRIDVMSALLLAGGAVLFVMLMYAID